jgi:uncharacterized protein YgiM (DUF1202 family)
MRTLMAAVAVAVSMGLAAAASALTLPPGNARGMDGIHSVQAAMGQTTVRVKSAILRAEANQRSKKLASLRRGTKVQILGTSGDWTKVRAGAQEGYVSTSLLVAK